MEIDMDMWYIFWIYYIVIVYKLSFQFSSSIFLGKETFSDLKNS